MRRPGFLNGYEGFTPKAVTFSSFRGFNNLGAFGKGYFAPPPGAPPPGVPRGGNTLPEAINTKTNKCPLFSPCKLPSIAYKVFKHDSEKTWIRIDKNSILYF